MNFEDLKSPELQEKLKNAKTVEELVAIAKAEGFELSDDQLESISGGEWHHAKCVERYLCPIRKY